jgi:hypothetical protein
VSNVSPDPWSQFGDLVEPGTGHQFVHTDAFPGSRPPINRQVDTPAPSDDGVLWDSHPLVRSIGGVEYEFFQVGSLAIALGRQPVTIRGWESKGLLPGTPFRSSMPSRSPLATLGKTAKGRRLYLRAQIEGIVQIAKEEGVIFPTASDKAGPPPTQKFAERVYTLYETLRQQVHQPQPQQGTPS